MFNKTTYQVIISPSGEQIIRSTASDSKTIIDTFQQSRAVAVSRRI